MARGSVRIKLAEPGDLAGIVQFVRAAVTTRTSVGPTHVRRTDAQLMARYEAVLDDPARSLLIAMDDAAGRDIVGMAVLAIDELSATITSPGVHVTHLVVASSHRRRGVGRALLAHAVRFAESHGIDHLAVAVLSDDRETHRYFARIGFAPLTVRRVASVSAVRRSLGLVDSAVERRLSLPGQRRVRRTLGAARVLRRGA